MDIELYQVVNASTRSGSRYVGFVCNHLGLPLEMNLKFLGFGGGPLEPPILVRSEVSESHNVLFFSYEGKRGIIEKGKFTVNEMLTSSEEALRRLGRLIMEGLKVSCPLAKESAIKS